VLAPAPGDSAAHLRPLRSFRPGHQDGATGAGRPRVHVGAQDGGKAVESSLALIQALDSVVRASAREAEVAVLPRRMFRTLERLL